MYWLPYSSYTSHHPSQTHCFPWISYATQKLMLDSCKMVEKQFEAFHTFLWHFFPSLKQYFIAYHSFKVFSRPDCIFEIHQLWQSGFIRVYSNCCCSCSFEVEIIKIGPSSHKINSNNIVNSQESMTILNACTKNSGNHVYMCVCVWLCVYVYIYIYISNSPAWAGCNTMSEFNGFDLRVFLLVDQLRYQG